MILGVDQQVTIIKRFPVYSQLLKLYPAAYRAQYGEEMLQTLADMLDNAPTRRAKIVIWLRTMLDLPISLAQQQLITAGGTMSESTPNYVKTNALIGGLLILPFFAIVIANSLSNHTLVNAANNRVLLIILLFGLPALAFVLNSISYIKWLSERKQSIGQRLLDIRHSWPAITIAGLGLLIALFVPFHDRVHCVTGNPIKELHNSDQTWTCIKRN